MSNSGKAEVLIPRSLCSIENPNNLKIDNEDLASVFISWENGFISDVKPINIKNKKPKEILFPRFVETHAHFDKSFTWEEFPNFKSNYDQALLVNLDEHKTRTIDKVIIRAEKSLNLAIKNGYRAIRTHIDTFDSQDKETWKELFNLQRKYSYKLKL